jgi:hypothetical protein
VNVSMWLASSAGLAVFGTLAASTSKGLLHKGYSPDRSLLAGYHQAFFIGAVLASLALLIIVAVLRAPAKEAHEDIESIEEEMSHFEIVAEY